MIRPTNHDYYCHPYNKFIAHTAQLNGGLEEHDNWAQFKEVWLDDYDFDDSTTHLFRYDIEAHDDPTGNPFMPTRYSLHLFFILQRVGDYKPVVIYSITENDIGEINAFLQARWEYMQGQWKEFSAE